VNKANTTKNMKRIIVRRDSKQKKNMEDQDSRFEKVDD
jgi:hypothetical protein